MKINLLLSYTKMVNLKEAKKPFYPWKLNWEFVNKPVQIFKTRIESCYRDERVGSIWQVWKQNDRWHWRQYNRNGTVDLYSSSHSNGYSTLERAMYSAQVRHANIAYLKDHEIPSEDLPDWLLEELEQYDIYKSL